MKTFTWTIALILFFSSCGGTSEKESNNLQGMHQEHQEHQVSSATTKPSKSPKKSAMALVNGNHIHVDYSSPSVRGRQIFGGLVAYGEVWSTGAHKATWIQFDQPIIIAGETIPAGKYGLFTIPNEKEWTIILNQVWDMHLADDYDPKKDVLRFSSSAENLEQSIESLTFEVNQLGENTAEISISWANTRVKFELNTI